MEIKDLVAGYQKTMNKRLKEEKCKIIWGEIEQKKDKIKLAEKNTYTH